MDEQERYFWDLTGYLVVRNVLTPDELAAANEAVDHYADRIRVGEDNLLAMGSQALLGTGPPHAEWVLGLGEAVLRTLPPYAGASGGCHAPERDVRKEISAGGADDDSRCERHRRPGAPR